ncbi:PREDICTED: uncharacterized protein LOC105359938 [Ceratosolen solmsi marchali]|uniref:Uncharacterized protein LOC105359938 n=1 Tax=Ceratosolen solmsi marchali TaxID=326594 RepID=A0AAJ6YCJ1_9HYME|nr:PREDICTED: uncharacterized protein LOC105359938 [Ceratosolen solmsi marchali]
MGLWLVYFILVIIISLEYRKDRIFSVSVSYLNAVSGQETHGTVLFDKSILNNHCWTNEEYVILSSRKMFQDLLPKIEKANIWSDQYIVDLYKYFYICFEYVCKLSTGTTRHLLLKALADVIGGYLYSHLLPVTKLSFYAGNVKYCNVKKIIALYMELKAFLNTNGEGWRKPRRTDMEMEMEHFINTTSIVLKNSNDTTACNNLIVNSNGRCLKPNISLEHSVNGSKRQPLSVFLPYLDNILRPNSIALPFKDQNLWSLHEEESISILSTYYETCVNCILTVSNYKCLLAHFNKEFYNWLLQFVYPRLNDDKFYPAFGSILRMIAYLRKAVATTEPSFLSPIELIIIAISSAILAWMLVGLILVCYRCHHKHSDECSTCDSASSDTAMIFKNANFCNPESSPSTASRTSVGNKITNWWRHSCKIYPNKYNKIIEKDQYLASMSYDSQKLICSHHNVRLPNKRQKRKAKSVSISVSPISSSCRSNPNKVIINKLILL